MNNGLTLAESKGEKSGFNQFPQQLDTWSNHVRSWVFNPVMPVHVVRYEDMLQDSFKTFSSILSTLGLEVGEKEIQKALNNSQFERLQQREKTSLLF